MTRDAEHTPSPQSVGPSGPKRVLVLKSAVERLILAADMYGVAHLDSDDMDDDAVELQDATEGMKDALAAAPAPSSLAGGEARARLIETLKRIDDGIYDCLNDQADAILAALSPEAPAREGGEIGEEFDNAAHCVTLAECPPGLFLWNGTLGFKSEYGAMEPDDATNGKHWKVGNRADAYCADSGEYFWGGTSTHDDRAKVLVYPIDAGTVAMVASHGPAALTPHHEAPAEGAGEAPQAAVNSLTRSVENFDNGYEWGCDPVAVRAILRHLRARSSAPEAREEALGNLLAVIHGDGGHRALEVGTKQAALEAEKIVANLLSSAPPAREARHLGGCSGPVQHAHVSYRVHGIPNSFGRGVKNHDRHGNPLCAGHHQMQHDMGDERAFWALLRKDAYDTAADHYAAYSAGRPAKLDGYEAEGGVNQTSAPHRATGDRPEKGGA